MGRTVRVGSSPVPDPDDALLAEAVALARAPLELEPPQWRETVAEALANGIALPDALAAVSVPLVAWQREIRADVVFARRIIPLRPPR